MNYSIGIDIGGTNVAIGIVNPRGYLMKSCTIETDLSIPPKKMLSRINHVIQEMIQQANITYESIIGIGIGAPGPLDNEKGLITHPPNLKGWRDVPIVNWMKQEWDFPILLQNDANVAALGEKWVGAGKSHENFIYMTISTGIGIGVMADGKLLLGRKGNAGDIGHMVVDPSFGQCSCGQYGCLEYIASGTAIARLSSETIGRKVSTKEAFQLYVSGQREIVSLIDRIFRVLGIAIVTLINTFDPEKIVIGGGVSKVGEPLFHAIQQYVRKYALNPEGRKTKIVPAKLGQDCGVIGAAALHLIPN